MKKFFRTMIWVMLSIAAWTFVSCSEDNSTEVSSGLEAPEIIQSEEISDNPITLAFSWEIVENAVSYSYQLDVIQGIRKWNNNQRQYDRSEYRNRQHPWSGALLFDRICLLNPGHCRGAIALSIENLTYRSAVLKGIPVDKSMLYQFAQIPIEKYLAYDSDMNFIEAYDYGYYQAMGQPCRGSPGTVWCKRARSRATTRITQKSSNLKQTTCCTHTG